MPAPTAHWRAGFSPSPAWSTFPMITSSTDPGLRPARFSASPTTITPRSVAENSFRLPPNVPMAVLAAPTMTTFLIPPSRPDPEEPLQIDHSHRPVPIIGGDPLHGGTIHDLHEGVQEVRLGDDPHQLSRLLHRQAPDAMGHHQFRRLLNLSVWGDHDEVSRHDLAHLDLPQQRSGRSRPDVTVGDNPHRVAVLDDRQVPNPMLIEERPGLGQAGIWTDDDESWTHPLLHEHHEHFDPPLPPLASRLAPVSCQQTLTVLSA